MMDVIDPPAVIVDKRSIYDVPSIIAQPPGAGPQQGVGLPDRRAP